MKNKLELKCELYSKEVINEAIAAFAPLVQITSEDGIDSTICFFENNKYPLERTINEFENYLIDLSNKKKLFE